LKDIVEEKPAKKTTGGLFCSLPIVPAEKEMPIAPTATGQPAVNNLGVFGRSKKLPPAATPATPEATMLESEGKGKRKRDTDFLQTHEDKSKEEINKSKKLRTDGSGGLEIKTSTE